MTLNTTQNAQPYRLIAETPAQSLHQTFTDHDIRQGLLTSRHDCVSTAWVRPCSIPLAKKILEVSYVPFCRYLVTSVQSMVSHMTPWPRPSKW